MSCKLVIATILRKQGETGNQTHFNTLQAYLIARGAYAPVVNPFSHVKALSVPIFAVRMIIDPLSGPLSVWWYRRWHYVFLLLALRRLLCRRGEVVVYAQCPVSAKAALRARRGRHQQVVMAVNYNVSQADEWVTMGKIEREDWVYRDIKRLERKVLPRLDGIVYMSHFARDAIERTIPESSRVRSAVIPNFVLGTRGRRRAGLTRDLINIGTLENRKNQAYLLRVLAAAKRLGRSYSLTLVGHGPNLASLTVLARELGVAEQVHFTGYRPVAAGLLPGHRAYVHAAVMENLPLAIIEAMACGLPVLAAPVGGIPEIISDGDEGLYWPLDDPSEGARKLVALLEDGGLYATMAAAAKRRFEEHFSVDVVAGRLVEFLCRGGHG